MFNIPNLVFNFARIQRSRSPGLRRPQHRIAQLLGRQPLERLVERQRVHEDRARHVGRVGRQAPASLSSPDGMMPSAVRGQQGARPHAEDGADDQSGETRAVAGMAASPLVRPVAEDGTDIPLRAEGVTPRERGGPAKVRVQDPDEERPVAEDHAGNELLQSEHVGVPGQGAAEDRGTGKGRPVRNRFSDPEDNRAPRVAVPIRWIDHDDTVIRVAERVHATAGGPGRDT